MSVPKQFSLFHFGFANSVVIVLLLFVFLDCDLFMGTSGEITVSIILSTF